MSRRGLSNKPLVLSGKQNAHEQKIEYNLTKEDCQYLLLEYPRLAEAYEQQVTMYADPAGEMNKKFWTTFLEKNIQYSTVPFGGNNPVFIPKIMDEKDYEDNYIHNQQNFAKSKQQTKDLKSVLDVNFVKNLGLDDLPQGFGAFHSNKEIDSLLNKVEN